MPTIIGRIDQKKNGKVYVGTTPIGTCYEAGTNYPKHMTAMQFLGKLDKSHYFTKFVMKSSEEAIKEMNGG